MNSDMKTIEKKQRPRVAVYCSSREELEQSVVEGSRMIARAIGECEADLVYGGVNAGLMHEVAAAAKKGGAKIIGVVPEVFIHRADPLCDEIVKARDLNDRKGLMIGMADVFIVLPGGIGTIDEWISTLSDIMVREKVDPTADRPILVWNHDDMYSGMASQLRATADSVYARGKRVDRSLLFSSAADLVACFSQIVKGLGSKV